MQTIYNNKLYNSRSELVRELLQEKMYNKSTIADFANVTPQTVEHEYKKMVKNGSIDDYYSKFIEQRKKARASKGIRRR